MTRNRPVKALKTALLANAVFSSACAAVFLAASNAVADWTGAPRAEIVSTGISLAIFVGILGIVITRSEPLGRWVLGLAAAIAAMDVLWVLTTPLKIASYSSDGQGLFTAIAAVVALFAWLQIRALVGIRRESRGGGEARPHRA